MDLGPVWPSPKRGLAGIAVVALVVGACAVARAPTISTTVPAAIATTEPGFIVTTASLPSTTVTSVPTTRASTLSAEVWPTVRIALVGDVMLGRGIGPVVRDDPEGLFEDVRFVISDADLAGANLESPLTHLSHIAPNPFALEADPAAARLLAATGFDLMSVANNHAGDAGRASILDTIEAVRGAGMSAIGGGANAEEAVLPLVTEVHGVRVGFLAFDATLAGVPASAARAGITSWNEAVVRSAVSELRSCVDVLVVSVHGGVEYRMTTDPAMAAYAQLLHSLGVDVVWGTGPHVVQPVYVIAGERPTVVATSLGNFVFDQGDPDTKEGVLLEVLADASGAAAYRVGSVDHRDRRVHFDGWLDPSDDAALLGDDWWALSRPVDPVGSRTVNDLQDRFRWGEVIDASVGEVDDRDGEDVVVAFLRPYAENPVKSLFPDRPWTDGQGRSYHLGVFRASDLAQEWVAGTVFEPVVEVVACDGSLAVGYGSERSQTMVAAGAWRWRGFGFAVSSTLPRAGGLGCVDINGDGRTDPVLFDLNVGGENG